jgi:hypothetical protein
MGFQDGRCVPSAQCYLYDVEDSCVFDAVEQRLGVLELKFTALITIRDFVSLVILDAMNPSDLRIELPRSDRSNR